jgi:hypothetical protein
MTTPEDIDKVINQLRAKWHAFPYMRLGQLLYYCTPDEIDDLFFVEDEDLNLEVDSVQATILMNSSMNPDFKVPEKVKERALKRGREIVEEWQQESRDRKLALEILKRYIKDDEYLSVSDDGHIYLDGEVYMDAQHVNLLKRLRIRNND